MRPSGAHFMSICRSRTHHKNTIRLRRRKPLHRLCIALCEGQLLCLHLHIYISVHTLPEPHISCICSYFWCERMKSISSERYRIHSNCDAFVLWTLLKRGCFSTYCFCVWLIPSSVQHVCCYYLLNKFYSFIVLLYFAFCFQFFR